MDFSEISITPCPAHPGTRFGVVAGKALNDDWDDIPLPNLDDVSRALDLASIKLTVIEATLATR